MEASLNSSRRRWRGRERERERESERESNSIMHNAKFVFLHGNSSLADNSQFWYGIRAIIDSEHVILVIWDFVSGLGGWCGWLKQKPEGHPTNLVASNEAYCIFFLQPMHWYLGLIQVHRGWFLLYCYCCKWPEFSPICPMFSACKPHQAW